MHIHTQTHIDTRTICKGLVHGVTEEKGRKNIREVTVNGRDGDGKKMTTKRQKNCRKMNIRKNGKQV